MEENGTVLEAKDDIAIVEVPRSPACKNCCACRFIEGEDKMIAEAKNLVKAKVGDKVRVETESKVVLKATLVVYIVPVLFLFLGYSVGSYLARKFISGGAAENTGVVLGFVLFAFSYVIVWLVDKQMKLNRKLVPVITRIASEQ